MWVYFHFNRPSYPAKVVVRGLRQTINTDKGTYNGEFLLIYVKPIYQKEKNFAVIAYKSVSCSLALFSLCKSVYTTVQKF